MPYSIETLTDDCYEGSLVLKNKFDIRNEIVLDKVEQTITSGKIAKALSELPFEKVDFEFYKKLHQYVFSDIYEWAGEIRKINMSKKGTAFCPWEKIDNLGNQIFNRLCCEDFFRGMAFDDFIDELTDLYCSLNYLHPFREGNGRIQRLFLSLLLKNLDMYIDFSTMDKDEFMIATIKSAAGDIFLLKDLLRGNIKHIK